MQAIKTIEQLKQFSKFKEKQSQVTQEQKEFILVEIKQISRSIMAFRML